MVSISNHSFSDENKMSTSEKNWKKTKGTSKTNSYERYKVILQLHNEIMNLKRNKGEGNNPFKPFI